MNNNLIERIDDEIKYIDSTDIFLLIDCKAEIERLLLANETLKGLCEDYQAQIKQHGIAQERQEAVLWVNKFQLDTKGDVGINALRKEHQDFGKFYDTPLYTAPPPSQDVQALIAEIDKWRTRGVDTYPTMAEILDKYRGMK